MRKSIEEKRLEKRACFEPSEMGHIIEATLDGKEYSFKILNICHGGIGMLVMDNQAEVLNLLKCGDQLEMNYINPKGSMAIKVEIRHISTIKAGAFKGHYSVGFSMSV
ncbi:MAG: hypothetical protein U9N77_01815 [Thermodesulfobacteriota bacterium]|nr:hypothetical protein [Thermodesulfobacteriota bacterium]